MRVVLEIDHTVSKEEIESWINDILLPENSCIWGYSFNFCDGACNKKKRNKRIKTKITNANETKRK